MTEYALSMKISPLAVKAALIFFAVIFAFVLVMFIIDYLKKNKRFMALYNYFRKNFKQMFRFALIGGSGVIINSAVIYAMTEWVHLYYMISNLFAIAIASVWNYVWYKYWVFKK